LEEKIERFTALEAIAVDRNSLQKHVWRANIILVSGAVKRGYQALDSIH
jgi:hypothetical protein